MEPRQVSEQAAALFSKTFEKMEEEQFYYKHFENPDRLLDPIQYIVWNNRICAMNAFDQVTLLMDGTEQRALQSSDSAVVEEMRGKHLFLKIQEKMSDEYKKMGGDVMFGIPNERSYPIFMKLGWKDVGRLYGYRKMSDPWGCLASLIGRRCLRTLRDCVNYAYRGYVITIGRTEEIINQRDIDCINDSVEIGIKRSLAYYQWRIFNNIWTDAMIVKVARNDVLEAMFVAARKKATHFVYANIVDWYVGNNSQENLRIIGKILKKSLKGWCDFSTIRFINEARGEDAIVRALGYTRREKGHYILIVKRMNEDLGEKIYSLFKWQFRGIDADTMMN